MTKIFQTFGTGLYFCSVEMPLVTAAFVAVAVPVVVLLFFLSLFPKTKYKMARIMARIHRAIKAAKIILFVDQPKIIQDISYCKSLTSNDDDEEKITTLC